ncbi:C-C motif chemokine 19-like [Thamnophis elegans]|uniref:C-C motif chemokine 19-like n=1 Tax=Thamnophis elegans TaxID=35005 RepID=UPI0013782F54|nr:C-C motif chemokine 19-like [Thamnophis elegans]
MILAPRLVLFLLLAAGLCLFQAQGMFSSQDCCEATRDRPISINQLWRFKGYAIQETKGGCSIKAFVLITRQDRKLCFPPDSSVTSKFKDALDKREARNKAKNLPRRKAFP